MAEALRRGEEIGDAAAAASKAAAILARPALSEAIETAQDRLSDAGPDLPLEFSFSWDGKRHAAKAALADGGATLSLSTALAILPYSSEDAQRRDALHALLDPALDLPDGSRFQLSPDQQVIYVSQAPLPAPVTSGAILSLTIQLLLASRPYLALAENLEG